MKKLAIVASSVALAAMPVVGVFATDTRTVTDTLDVTVNDTCTMTNNYVAGSTGNAWGTKTTDETGTYFADANTWTATLNNSDAKTSPVHTLAITCNKTSGWTLKAKNAAALSTSYGGTATEDTIGYSTSAQAGTEGYYVGIAKTAGSDADAELNNVSNGKMSDQSEAIGAGGTIFSKEGSTATASLDITYTVATSATTEAGNYTGDVVYTLAPAA